MAASLPSRTADAYQRRDLRDLSDEGNFVTRAIERARPDAGYAALALVLLLAALVGWSIADARWILGRDELTSFLIQVGVGGALWGYAGSKLPIPPWLAQVIGATIGAFVVVLFVGSLLPGAVPTLDGWIRASARSVAEAYLDLVWRHHPTTLQFGHFGLILGILVWGTAQAASFSVFGHRRAINGVILLSVVFVGNMSQTLADQYQALILFSAAALGLLLLTHAADERADWLRHRIWRGRDYRGPHFTGGSRFAAGSIFAAVLLTAVASSAPLAGPLAAVGGNFTDFATWISGYLPAGGQSRYQPSMDFGYTAPISSSFRPTSGKAFTVTIEVGLPEPHWRMVAYDQFQSLGWAVGPGTQAQEPSGRELTAGTLDGVGAAQGRSALRYAVHVEDPSIRHLLAVSELATASTNVRLLLVGAPSDFDIAAITTSATDYSVSARVPSLDPAGTGLTEWLLRHASTKFPAGIMARYTQGTNFVGAGGRALLVEIGDWARSSGNPFNTEYDVAKAVQAYLQSSRFTYTTDISSEVALKCTGVSTVDCFALLREGFCEQYASTMTMLMRLDGYPARYVQGFLGGQVDPATGTQELTSTQKHAWVEVFFPGFGWIPFDPTGTVGQPTILPAGAAVTPGPSLPPTPLPTGGEGGGPVRTIPPEGGDSGSGGGATSSGGGVGPLVIGTGILAGSGLLIAVLWFRRPRRMVRPETAFEGVVAWASRLGYRPRPSQTMLEYSGMLADVVPDAREPLEVVAAAAVEVAYGRRQLGEERLARIARAYGQVRVAFLRLLLRLPRMWRRR